MNVLNASIEPRARCRTKVRKELRKLAASVPAEGRGAEHLACDRYRRRAGPPTACIRPRFVHVGPDSQKFENKESALPLLAPEALPLLESA